MNKMLRIAILTACGRSSFLGRSVGKSRRNVAKANPCAPSGEGAVSLGLTEDACGAFTWSFGPFNP